LIDLAARRWLTIEEAAPGSTICRLRGGGTGTLMPYEKRVLDHIQSVCVDGVVPAEALTTGPEAASSSWWRGFRREVTADARNRGLVRPRWLRWLYFVLWAGAIGAGLLLWLARSGTHDDRYDGAAIAVGVAI